MPHTAAASTPVQPAIQVSRKDLPLSCPPPDAPVWNLHPRVYLPIEDEPHGEAVCPYCGARYVLTD
ncbi:zinc-finger domain-containing protein [uncultured Thiocystis sp.]|uniref:zinc-finger domain-containing protein n=1 Tax=uncultured Thiocystis sp. TaxID=1202134 RepID=UPI0025E5BE47|nr:zinc-finger domain-containing protein [uncultured Thiocystis sp.]